MKEDHEERKEVFASSLYKNNIDLLNGLEKTIGSVVEAQEKVKNLAEV